MWLKIVRLSPRESYSNDSVPSARSRWYTLKVPLSITAPESAGAPTTKPSISRIFTSFTVP